MNTSPTLTAKNPVALAKRLFKLERTGRYAEALDDLACIWPDPELLPELESFEQIDAAELLLRCGSLIGFHGHSIQRAGTQERSRDLLMAAHKYFAGLKNVEKLAECENYIALSYWRTGEMNEAQIWVDESLSRPLPNSSVVKLFSYIVQCLVNIPAKKDRQNLAALKSLEAAFLACDDECLKGDFYNHCGLALDNLNRQTEAVEHFELAKYYHECSGHNIYLATVENNLAWLYKDAGRFARAHEAANNATRLFRKIKDKTREGFSLDTKASLYFAEARYEDALRTVERALIILKSGENTSYLIETLLTKAKILVFCDNFTDAMVSLIDAVNIARVQTGEAAAKRLISEFDDVIRLRNKTPGNKPGNKPGTDDLEFILPSSIGQYLDYRGVWINNGRLEDIGLAKGSLAIVAKTDISKGDLVALSEIVSNEVSCGFYDADFGIVCLDNADGDPLVFNETDVQILGKIVGVCNSGRDKDGRMAVEVLNL